MRITIEPASTFEELQRQFSLSDATYVINFDQQTFGTSINPLIFPQGCRLEFCGGAFVGGCVLFNGLLQNDVSYPVWKNVSIRYETADFAYMGFFNEYLRPEWFGAVGDGFTDDSVALQQCINEARFSGSKVFLAAKRYLLKQTIYLFSGSCIEGNLPGSIDQSVQIGSSLVFDLPEATDVAIDLNSGRSSSIDISGGYKFIIKRLGIVNYKLVSNIGIRLISEEERPVPREGLIENVLIRYFETSVQINALSYVKFSQICLTDYKVGIKIDKLGRYLEFGWFHNVYMNTGEPDSVGLDIGSGNNLYFNEVDINGCSIGIEIHSEQAIFNNFFSRINLTSCETGVSIRAVKNFITRLKFAEVTIYRSTYGFLFDRCESYNIGESSFVDIIDSAENDGYFLMIKDRSLSLSSCVFERIRVLGRIVGFSHVRKLNLINLDAVGEFVVSAGSRSYTHIVTNRSVLDFIPSVIVDCNDKGLLYSVSVTNTLFGTLSIRIDLESSLLHDVRFNYMFTRLS